ncbi:MAG: multiheme c-type cytochrome [Gemmataceae bacterium]
MERDQENTNRVNGNAAPSAPRATGQPLLIKAGLPAFLLIVVIATGLLMGCWLRPQDKTKKDEESTGPFTGDLFQGWPKPDVAIVLSGQRHGYILPCGCSRPQVGGLERLYNFVQTLKAHDWPVAGFDLGDIPQQQGPLGLPNVQGALKYVVSMKAYERIGFGAVSFGEYEAALPLNNAIDRLVTDPESPSLPILAYNLKNKDKFLDRIKSWEIVEPKGSALKVGVLGAIGTADKDGIDQIIKQKDPSLEFERMIATLPKAVNEMDAAKPDVKILLYQGSVEHAVLLAEHADMPKFDIILCLGADEPPSRPEKIVGKTQIVTVGHKGKYVGVVGVYKTQDANKPFELRYQLVKLGEEYLTPEGKEKQNPVLTLMEQYTKTLKDEDKLSQYPHNRKHATQTDPKLKSAVYVGSDKCKGCHKESFEVWKKSGHAHAYETLVDAKRPSLRQFDGECLVCHTIGFDQKSGWLDKGKPKFLAGVGCESCHGPGSLHVEDPDDVNNLGINDAINPFKLRKGETEAQRVNRRITSCVKCHDDENDVNWGPGVDKWEKIAHSDPKHKKKAK